MSGMDCLKKFDSAQIWRFFVDGRFHNTYQGWKGYDDKEPGSIQALVNGFSFVLNNYDISKGLNSHYIVDLHKICLANVQAKVEKSTPGDLRYLDCGMACFAGETSLDSLKEIFKIRANDGTKIFHNKKYNKVADELNYEEIYEFLQKERRIRYRPWYPELNQQQQAALDKKSTLEAFYDVKNYVQKQFSIKLDEIVNEFNLSITEAKSSDEKLYVFSKLIRDLELLHPFPDGNCRVFACILLNHLLMFYDFYPTILYNPNRDGERSYKEFIEEIKTGIEKTKILLKNPNERLYGYSILDMSQKDKNDFNQITESFLSELKSTKPYQKKENIFLDLFMLISVTGGVTVNTTDDNIYFTDVIAAFNGIKKNCLYFLTNMDSWLKPGVKPSDVLIKIHNKGAALIVIDNADYVKGCDVPVLVVDNELSAMRSSAAHVRDLLNPKRVLITGTVGKTGFKFQLYHLLNQQTACHIRKDSGNMDISICASLASLKTIDEVEITEVAVGGAGMGEKRSSIVYPDVCVFTEIGQCHMDGHKSIEKLIENKASVVAAMKDDGLCIINAESEYAYNIKNEILKIKKSPIYFFGENKICDAELIKAEYIENSCSWNIKARIEEEIVEYSLPLINAHAPIVSMGVLLTVKKLGFDVEKAAKDYSDFIPYETMGKLHNIKLGKGSLVFYDQSRRGSIQNFRSAFKDYIRITSKLTKGRKIVVLAGTSIYNDTQWTQEQHKEIAGILNNAKIQQLYTVGEYMNYVHENINNDIELVAHGDTYKEIEGELLLDLKENDQLIIIGHGRHNLNNLANKVMKLEG